MSDRFRIFPLPTDILDTVRGRGSDASGNPVVPVVATGGEPLRCCLRDAKQGEDLILFGYEPPLPASPYREVGAVFAHGRRCTGPAAMSEHGADAHPVGEYPADWYGRSQVLRAYDERGWIHPATRVHDGSDPVGALTAVLAEPGVVQVHSRNVGYGCFMFKAARIADEGSHA